MGKSLVRQMLGKGRCALCGRQLASDNERKQELCGRCYETRRLLKKWDKVYGSTKT